MLLDIPAASKELSIAPVSVRRLVRAEAIPYRRIGCRILFTPEDLQEYIAAAKHPIRQVEMKAEVNS